MASNTVYGNPSPPLKHRAQHALEQARILQEQADALRLRSELANAKAMQKTLEAQKEIDSTNPAPVAKKAKAKAKAT